MTFQYLTLQSEEWTVREASEELSQWGNPGDKTWEIRTSSSRSFYHKTNGYAWFRAIWSPHEYWFYGYRASPI